MYLEFNGQYNAAVAIASAVIFFLSNRFLEYFGFISAKVPQSKRNLWFNTLVSLIHSTIASAFCVLCFYVDPWLWTKMTDSVTSDIGRITPFISIGYFSFDFFDTLMRLKVSNTWPVLLHHVIVVSSFIAVVIYLKYYYYLIVALTCEVNTIFLHLRQLFHLSNVPQDGVVYRVNKHVNFITYIIFRMVTLIWMIIVAFSQDREVFPSLEAWFVGTTGMFLMFIINVVLLQRVVRRDYLNSESTSKKAQ